MTPGLGKILAAAGAVLLIIGSLVFGFDSCHKRRGAVAETIAHIAEGEANAHQSAAGRSDARLPEIEARLAEATAGMAGARAEVARLRKALATRPEAVPGPDGAPTAPDESLAADPRDALIASQDVLIASQDAVITEQARKIAVLQVSRDEWKNTAEARERQALAQEAATRAWKSAVTTSRWRGRVEGFAAGAALGYLGGRR